jgi:UDP-glucose 4-epimerase
VPDVVLVTGVSRFLGGHIAARLAADPTIGRVLGVDAELPSRDLRRHLGRTEFVRADIRDPLIVKVITAAEVDTVVHASLSTSPGAGRRTVTKEVNVLGTMQLLAACQAAPLVRKLVVKSSSTVYGSSRNDPVVFTEDMGPRSARLTGYPKDAVEVEGYLRGFARQRPDVVTTTLRFANFIGPRIDSVLTRYFSLPLVPTVFGFDARLQLLHSDDAVAVLHRATSVDLPGVYNVAATGVLMLSQAIRRAGRVSVPVPSPMLPLVSGFFRGTGLIDFSPEQMRYLNFGRVLDTRALREDFGYTPKWDTASAFADYVRGRDLRPLLDKGTVDELEQAVIAVAGRARRVVGR